MPPTPSSLDPKNVGVASNYFEVRGRLRLDERALEERSIVERRGLDMVTILRERVASVLRRPLKRRLLSTLDRPTNSPQLCRQVFDFPSA